MTVHFRPADEEGAEVLVAYAISRKVGGAVVRNHWRRRLRAISAEAAGNLSPGAYLVAVNPAVRDLHFDELRERVIDTMRKVSEGTT